MKVLAQYDNWFLIETEPDVGRVFDRARGRLYGPLSLTSLYAKRRWEPFTGNDADIRDDMSMAEHVGSGTTEQRILPDPHARSVGV